MTKLKKDVERMLKTMDVASSTEQTYRRVVRQYSKWLGRTARRKDLTEVKINDWLADLKEAKYSGVTGLSISRH